MMTDFKSKTLASGAILQTFDKEGLLAFMQTDRAFAAGVVVALIESDGRQGMLVFAGQPLNEKLSTTLNDTVSLATLLVLPAYYDRRHAEKICRDLMQVIAEKRGLTPADPSAMSVDEVPYGDRDLVATLLAEVVSEINDVMDRELV